MAGGLIQLVTTGIQDSPIIGNPEITFFKTVYRQHTMFSLCQNDRFIGNLHFGKEGSKVIEKNGDLLFNQTFRLEIPYFEIIKTQNVKELIRAEYDINQLSIEFMNQNCIVVNLNNLWYIVPEKLFKIGEFEYLSSEIESAKIQNKLLPEFITSTDLGKSMTFYNIKESKSSPIISLLRIESEYWEQFWLDFIDQTQNPIYYNALQTLTGTFKRLYQSLRKRMFTDYYRFNSNYKYSSYLTVDYWDPYKDDAGNSSRKNEIERYLEYVDNFEEAIKSNTLFEIDIVYKYCKDNNLNFENYRDYYLETTPLVLLMMYKMIYSNNDLLFTFWKKYEVYDDNAINKSSSIANVNFVNEWSQMLYYMQNETLATTSYYNIVFDEFYKKYTTCEKNIINLFETVSFVNYKNFYVKLKVFLARFLSIPKYCVNFSSVYLPYKYTNINDYIQDDYTVQVVKEQNNYPYLNTDSKNLDPVEMNNLVPVNLELAYCVFAEDLLEIVNKYNFISKQDVSFLSFWKNCVVDLVYKNFIDTHLRVKQNPSLVNSDDSLKLTYYYTLNPGNMITSSYINNMWYEMFYKTSWLGMVSIGNNNFIKMKENIFTIRKNLPNELGQEQNGDFYKLSISNDYSYIYYPSSVNIESTDNFGKYNTKDILYNGSNKKLYVRYDNYYDENLVTLVLRNKTQNKNFTFKSVKYEIMLNEKFRSCLYLTFELTGVVDITSGASSLVFELLANDVITLTATYTNYLPIVNFYEDQIQTPKISSTKFKLLEKNLDGEVKLLKISDGFLTLENASDLVTSNKTKFITINYLNSSNIVPPDTFNLTKYDEVIEDEKYLSVGTYGYAISFYTSSSESDISDITYINIPVVAGKKSFVIVSSIPISGNKNVIGRKIYRTQLNSTKLLLLTTISNNTSTTYNDKINDINLGFEYMVDETVKINELASQSTTVQKTMCRVVETSGKYKLVLDGVEKTVDDNNVEKETDFKFPTDYTQIKEIYIEEFDNPYELITNGNFSISSNGTVKLTNPVNFSSDHLYWLVSNGNFKNSTKLVPSKKKAYYGSLPVSSELVPGGISSPFIQGNTYYYYISFYSTQSGMEALPTTLTVNMSTSNKYIQINLPAIIDTKYNSWKIYRKNNTDGFYYFVKTVETMNFNIYVDSSTDVSLTVKYEEPFFYITKPINTQTINRPDNFIVDNSTEAKPVGFTSGSYKYEITYLNTTPTIDEETISSVSKIFEITKYKPVLKFTLPADSRITSWKIYRSDLIPTGANPDNYPTKLIGTKNLTDVPLREFIDPLVTQTASNPPTSNNKNRIYNILKVPIANVTPNLNNFISHSTDFELINDKNLSDLSDFMFNKPMVMIVNNTSDVPFNSEFESLQSLNSQQMYFYNVGFKITLGSRITLDDLNVSYVMPLSTQQFFVKPNSEKYYKINKVTNTLDEQTDSVVQNTFNPAFDEFNISREFINSGYYYTDIIDQLSSKYKSFLTESIDFQTSFDIIDKTINEYKDVFRFMLNFFVGSTTSYKSFYGILTYRPFADVSRLNKFFNIFKSKTHTISLTSSVPDSDFIKYSRSGIRNIKINDNELAFQDLITVSNTNKSSLKILSPAHKKFKSENRLSQDFQDWLKNYAKYNEEHVNYINNNKDFLSILNPKYIENKFLSISEIKQEINDKFFDYAGSSEINTLLPIVDNQIDKIIIPDKNNNQVEITNFTQKPYQFITNEYNTNKEQNNYVDRELDTNNVTKYANKKFNYVGIMSLDLTGNFNFEDEYTNALTTDKQIIFDDGIVRKGIYNSTEKRHSFATALPECLVVNPIELDTTNIKLANPSNETITIDKLGNNIFIYEYSIDFSSNLVNNISVGEHTLILGLEKVPCVVKSVGLTNIKMITIFSKMISINEKQLIFMLSDNSYKVTPNISVCKIQMFKEINYKANFNTNYTGIITDCLIKIGTDYYTTNAPFVISSTDSPTYSGFYFTLQSTSATINTPIYRKSPNATNESDTTKNYITTKDIKSFIIKKNLAYSNYLSKEYSNEIMMSDEEHYFMLINQNKKRYYICKKKNIKLYGIPSGNYHVWILPQSKLSLIQINLPYTVNTTVGNTPGTGNITGLNPTKMYNYCFYGVINLSGEECYYYYENGTSITVNSPGVPYYSNINQSIQTKIYMVDNDLFNVHNPQFVKSYKTRNCKENFITNVLQAQSSNQFNFDTNENISYNSVFSSNTIDVNTFNSTECKTYGSNETIVNLVLSRTTPSRQIIQPVILAKYDNVTIPMVTFTANSTNYESSIIPQQKAAGVLGTGLDIGNITSTGKITSLDTNLSCVLINPNTYKLTLSSLYVVPTYTKFTHTKWSLQQEKNGKTTIFYIWVVFVDPTDSTTFGDFLALNTDNSVATIKGFPQPLIANAAGEISIPGILSVGKFTLQNENIFIKVTNDAKLKINESNYDIGYKYYESVRNIDVIDNTHKINPLNFSGVLNIKPDLISFYFQKRTIGDFAPTSTSPENKLYQDVLYMMVISTDKITNQRKINIERPYLYKVDDFRKKLQTDYEKSSTILFYGNQNSSMSVVVSIQNPIFISNIITLVKVTSSKFLITTYDKLYLEKNEVISIDSNYYLVKGLNIFNDCYELELISGSSTNLYVNSGYYTYGIYTDKKNKDFEISNPNNIIEFTSSPVIKTGEIYLENSQLVIAQSDISENINNTSLKGKFTERGQQVKLFYSNGKFYLFDNFIKIKKFDKIVYIDEVTGSVSTINVLGIRDYEILFANPPSPAVTDKFYTFILPYQPFISEYVSISLNGQISSSEPIENNITIGIPNSQNINIIDLYCSTNSKINNWTGLAGNYWIYKINTNYKKEFDSSLQIPKAFTSSIKNQHSISVNVTYEKIIANGINNSRFKLDDPAYFVKGFVWFFAQPIKVFGLYSYIKNIVAETSNGVTNYYIYIKNETNTLLVDLSNSNLSTIMYISCSVPNMINYNFYNRFRYNYAIQLDNYTMDIGTPLEVVRCALKSDELVFIDTKINNKKIVFKYGISIKENERENGILPNEYTNIYFYNYCMINPDGTINNFDTLIGTYYLLSERDPGQFMRVQFVKMISGGKIKNYTRYIVPDIFSYNLSKFIAIKQHYDGEFHYANQQIVESKVLTDKNPIPFSIIKKYPIKFKGVPVLANNQHTYEIIFTGSQVVDTNIYDYVYFDETFSVPVSIKKLIVGLSTKYYLISTDVISNNITNIYTKNINYVLSSTQITKVYKNKNLQDNTLDFYVNTQIINKEEFVQNLLISKINSGEPRYKFKLIDGTQYNLNTEESSTIETTFSRVKSVDNNNNIIIGEDLIDNDLVELNNEYVKVTYYYTVKVDVSTVFDELLLFNSVKHLKLKLLGLCSIKKHSICTHIKPWSRWSLLASAISTATIKPLLNLYAYVSWTNSSAQLSTFNNPLVYGNLTKNEVVYLKEFIKTINQSNVRLQNYIDMKTKIEPLVFLLIENMLTVPEFYLNVVDSINIMLKSFGYDVIFDGYNIIFNNDPEPPYINIDGENEVVYYLSNEYTYDSTDNTVYRSISTHSQIVNQVSDWINKVQPNTQTQIEFGIGINKLLRYVKKLGDQLKTLLDNFTHDLTDTPNYYYMNPIKFLVGKIWEKYSTTGNLVNLEKEFTDKLVSYVSYNYNPSNAYDLITYDYLFKTVNYGSIGFGGYKILSYSNIYTDVNPTEITELKPYSHVPVIQENGLIINPIYKYKLNLYNNEVLSNCNYYLDFLNGDKINETIDLSSAELYPDQINFSLNYNIKPYDFYTLIQEKKYQVISTKYLGFIYEVRFSQLVNLEHVDEIFLNGNNIVINEKDIVNQIIYLNIPEIAVTVDDLFELRNYELIKSYTREGNNLTVTFFNEYFVYVSGQTFIFANGKEYYLNLSNGKYQIQTLEDNLPHEIQVITCLTPLTIVQKDQVLFEYEFDPPILDTDYRPINDNFIFPLEFNITGNPTELALKQDSSLQSITIVPKHVHTFGDNKVVLHFTNTHYTSLSDSRYVFDTVIHKKRICEDLANEIVSLTKSNEFLYYVNVKYPVCENISDTKTFLYYNITDGNPTNYVFDIKPNDGILEPIFSHQSKKSIYFSQTNTSTYFSNGSQYSEDELKKNVGFIHKNAWTIEQSNYLIKSDSIEITMPDDFVLVLISNISHYTFNGTRIPESEISSYSNKLVLKWKFYYGTPTGPVELLQYFIEPVGKVFKPIANRKFIAQLEYPYQYVPTENFYLYQYDSTGSKFDNFLYLIETTEDSVGPNGFFQSIPAGITMTIVSNNNYYQVKVIDKVRSANKTCYLVSYSDKLDIGISYNYFMSDYKIKQVISIKYYQDGLQFANFYSQNELDTVSIFLNESVHEFLILDDEVVSDSFKFYLVSYEKTNLTNLFYSNEFIQNIKMNKLLEYNTSTIVTKIKPEWNDYSKFFSAIKLYFNDQLIEELNENTYAIDKYLYSTEEKRNQKNKMCEIKFDGKKWVLYLPLLFWYAGKSGLSIPTVAMPNTEIRIKYFTNNIEQALLTDITNTKDTTYTFTKIPEMSVTMITDYILLDDMERKLFGSYAHEYVIDRYQTHPETNITDVDSVIRCNFRGLIKDIHLITKPISNKKLTYYPKKITKYDAKYDQYVKVYNYYLELVINGKYTSNEQRNYAIDIEIVKTVLSKYALYKISTDKLHLDFSQINRLTGLFSNWENWSDDMLKYLMYFENKYLGQITDNKRKEYILAIYLKHQFSNVEETDSISPIQSLCFKANGTSLFAERDYTYFTDVIPYQKFKNSLPAGYYTYTFSLYPTEDQHSGHLNFSNFDDAVIKIKSNPLVKSDPYGLTTITREYNILRFMSGHCSLAWM